MNLPQPAQNPASFFDRLRACGVEPDDSVEVRQNKTLLILATGLVASMMFVWVLIYHLFDLSFSRELPILFEVLLLGNALLFIVSRRFDFFQVTQLGLFLFLPFIAQWLAGNLIASSGVIIWGVLAPIGAILCFGAHQSLGWFIAWVVLTAASGAADYFLADPLLLQKSAVTAQTSLLFFTLNFIAVASISYALLRFSIEQKLRARKELEESTKLVMIAQDAADHLFLHPLI